MKQHEPRLPREWRSTFRVALFRTALLAALLGAAGYDAITYLRRYPQNLPWSPLQLDKPVGLSTGRKLAALGRSPQQCHVLLDQAHVAYRSLPSLAAGHCGLADGIVMAADHGGSATLVPASPIMSCPVSVALLIWLREVVQPAARRFLGSPVTRINHLGTQNCRRIDGRITGPWSEHATAKAIDIAGFGFKDGSSAIVRRDWTAAGPKGRFLHAVRDGACRLFATTLSPDYNGAHHDHLHLDEAAHGGFGWRSCR